MARLTSTITYGQGSPKEWAPGFENFVPAVAYHFCLTMPAKFSQPWVHSFGNPCALSKLICILAASSVWYSRYGPRARGQKRGSGRSVGRSIDRSIMSMGPLITGLLGAVNCSPRSAVPSPITDSPSSAIPSSKSSQGPLQSDYDGVGVRRARRGNGWNLAAKNYHSMRHRSINQAPTESRGASNREGGMTAPPTTEEDVGPGIGRRQAPCSRRRVK